MRDLRQVAVLRNNAAAYESLQVESLSHTSKCICQPLQQAMAVEDKLRAAQLHLEAWEHFKKAANDEAALFSQSCLEMKQQGNARIVHDLAEAARTAEAATQAA